MKYIAWVAAVFTIAMAATAIPSTSVLAARSLHSSETRQVSAKVILEHGTANSLLGLLSQPRGRATPEETDARISPAFPSSCGGWCLYTGTGYSGIVCGGEANDQSLTAPCRNTDESVGNDIALCAGTCSVRLYYSPLDENSAHTCIDYDKAISNLNNSKYTFNSGSGEPGYGKMVWRNVAGVTYSGGTCSDPIASGY